MVTVEKTPASCYTSIHPLLLQVNIYIPAHPRLRKSDRLQCLFGDFVSDAIFDNNTLVTCSLPDPVEIPPTPDQQGN